MINVIVAIVAMGSGVIAAMLGNHVIATELYALSAANFAGAVYFKK